MLRTEKRLFLHLQSQMKKTSYKILLIAAVLGAMAPGMTSCSADDDNANVEMMSPMALTRFEGQWILDGQLIGSGMVSIDSTQVLMRVPMAEMASALMANLNNYSTNATVQVGDFPLRMKAKYVGVSHTSRYYDLPAAQMTFEMTVDHVAYNVKLQTVNTGSVALLQEEKHSLSVVVKIVETSLEKRENGQVVAVSKEDHTLIFESDI